MRLGGQSFVGAICVKIDEMFHLRGTAFCISSNLVVTSAHVSGANDANLFVSFREMPEDGYQDTTDFESVLFKVELIAYDPIKDVSVLKMSGDISGSLPKLGSPDGLTIGCPLVTLGFPHADHGRMVLTRQTTSLGAKIIITNSGLKSKHMVLNIQTRPGQSGSPVLSIDGKTVVGMVLGGYAPHQQAGISLGGIDPQTLHQTTHAISAEYIKVML